MEPDTRKDKIIAEIKTELARAEQQHPDYPDDIIHCISIVNEEAGEATKAVVDCVYYNGSLEDVRKELRQTAAMCIRMLESLYPEQK